MYGKKGTRRGKKIEKADLSSAEGTMDALLDAAEYLPLLEPAKKLLALDEAAKILKRGSKTIREDVERKRRLDCLFFGCPDDSGIDDDGGGGSSDCLLPLTTTSDTTQSRSDF